MKCPKCGYLGFEHVPKCRNCGYDFSLTSAASVPDLPIRGAPATPNPDDELPLFGSPVPDDDQPLITRPAAPRAPLSVRRATPDVPRLRSEPPRTANFELDLEEPAVAPTPEAEAFADGTASSVPEDASVWARLLAVTIDLAVLAAIDALVVYLTLQICGITLQEIDLLPKGPLLAFLIVQNGGYLVAFTAGGQTLGKMAAGIRVVSSDEDEAVDVGRALLRTVMWIALAIPVGLGFVTALFSRNHRGLHDRFAGTRVVR